MPIFPKGFFNSPVKKSDIKSDIKKEFKGKTYYQYGDEQCRDNAGDPRALEICLSHIFSCFREEYKKDSALQDKLKQQFREKLAGLSTENENLNAQIEDLKNKIQTISDKIGNSEERIKSIRENPQQITKEKLSKVGFTIGTILIFFLTCYLFVFYSSATYSAFFKEFTRNDIGIASSIFDPLAVSKAYQDGIFELALIILAPFIFLALGFLIHKFVEHKEAKTSQRIFRFLKVTLLLFVTFIFDCIIAFKITNEIYKLNETLKSPPFDFNIAIHDINFWTIIFAGFIVYIIWGLVFSFTMDEYEKFDAVQMAIKNEQKKINQWNEDIDKLKNEIDLKTSQIQNNKKRISELQETLNGGLIQLEEFEPIYFEFLSGWIRCIEVNSFGEDKKQSAFKLSQEFLTKIKSEFKPINN